MPCFSPLITQLIAHLRCLPGVGPRSAQRMAFHLLERARSEGLVLANSIEKAIQAVGHCGECRNLSEVPLCTVCASSDRDSHLLCVVENPIDLMAIEQTASYRGYYFVLMGRLSPLDGIGPEEIGIKYFEQRLLKHPPQEVILATNPTVEGEATAYYLAELVRSHGIKTSRIAHGVPLGSELEFIDGNTLSRSLQHRTTV